MGKTRYLSSMTTQPSIEAKIELTPKDKLRVGVNHSNFLLSTRDPVSGAYSGIVIDLAAELARRLDVAFDVVGFKNPGLMADAAQSDMWDIAFMGSEPARANVIAFSSAYLEIDAGYLVPPGSPIQHISEVDRKDVRIALMDKSAYDLYLSRHIKHATLIRTLSIDASFEVFVRDQLEVLAGLKPRLTSDASKFPGARILDGRFTAIQQSIGTPKGRDAGAKFLLEFVEEIKATGLVETLITKHNVHGVSVAAAAMSFK